MGGFAGRRVRRVVLAVVLAVGVVAAGLPSREESAVVAAPPGLPVPGDEVVEWRTATSKTFVGDEPGQFRTELYATPEHVERDGSWVEIDTALVPAGEVLRPRVSGVAVEVGADASAPTLGRVEVAAGVSAAFGAPSAVGSADRLVSVPEESVETPRPARAEVDGPRAVFAEVTPGVSVELEVLRSGLKETLVLAGPSAPDRFVFPLQLEGLTARKAADGGLELVDAGGAVRLVVPTGYMVDSRVADNEGASPVSFGVVYELVEGPGGPLLEVRLDREWLSAPERVFPVRVDPTFVQVVAHNDDTYVALAPGDRSAFVDLHAGNGGLGSTRSFLHFDVSSLAGVSVQAADLVLWNNGSGSSSCGASSTWVDVYRVTQGWSSDLVPPTPLTDWPGPATGELVGSTNESRGGAGCAADWVKVPVVSLVQQWASGAWANFGVGVRARDESGTGNWRRYGSSESLAPPHLNITWSAGSVDEVVYDSLGRLKAVVDRDFEAAVYSHDDLGNVTGVSRYPVSQLSVIQLEPTEFRPQDDITIFGTGFDPDVGDNQVVFHNNKVATVLSATPTRLRVRVPGSATSGNVAVTVAGNTVTAPYTIRPAAPTIGNGTLPTVAQPGESITVNGTRFDTVPTGNVVRIGRFFAPVVSSTASKLTVQVPPAMGVDAGNPQYRVGAVGKIQVENHLGPRTATKYFFTAPETYETADVVTASTTVGAATITVDVPAGRKATMVAFESTGSTPLYMSTQVSGITCTDLSRISPTLTAATQVTCNSSNLQFTPEAGVYYMLLRSDGAAGTFKFRVTTGVHQISYRGGDPSAPSAGGPAVGAPFASWASMAADDVEPHLPSLPPRTVVGRAVDASGQPMPDAKVTINEVVGHTGPNGWFRLDGVAPGRQTVSVDARRTPGGSHGYFSFGLDVAQDGPTEVPGPLALPAVDESAMVEVASPTAEAVVLTHPAIPGLEVRIPAGVSLVDHEYRPVTRLGIVPVDSAALPIPGPPGGFVPGGFFTVQGGGAHPAGAIYLHGGTASIVYPNTNGFAPGHRSPLLAYAPAEGWYEYGQGTVSDDGSVLVPDAGAGVWNFTGMGWPNQWDEDPRPEECPWWKFWDCPNDGDPVSLRDGRFSYNRTDLAVDSHQALTVDRYHNPADTEDRSFGKGGTLGYDTFLRIHSSNSVVDLYLPDGAKITFKGTSGTNSRRFVHYGTASEWYGAVVHVPSNHGGVLRTTAGVEYEFNSQGQLVRQRDPNGNQVHLFRGGTPGQNAWGAVQAAVSEDGRWLKFTYANGCVTHTTTAHCRLISAEDNLGRRVDYAYTGNQLTTITAPPMDALDPASRPQYVQAYDGTSGRIKSIHYKANAAAPAELRIENFYDANGRVDYQLEGGQNPAALPRWDYDYTVVNGTVTKTTVTDPHGAVREVVFGPDGVAADTAAKGTAWESTTHYTYEPVVGDQPAGLVSEVLVVDGVYPAGRRTTFTYNPDGLAYTGAASSVPDDASLHEATVHGSGPDLVTRLTYTYVDPFIAGEKTMVQRVASERLPGNRTWVHTYTASGNLATTADPTGRTRKFELHDANGYPTRIRSSANGTSTATMTWSDNGDLRSVTDQDGRTISYLTDGAGRPFLHVDGAGYRTYTAYNPLNTPRVVIDPAGRSATYQWSDRGVVSLEYPAGQVHTTVYNEFGAPAVVTDPFGASTVIDYRDDGLVEEVTSRAGRRVTYGYNSIGVADLVSFSPPGGPVESTQSFGYDPAGRLSSVTDSAGGSVTWTHDDYDRPLTEVSAEGTVTYAYDPTTARLGSVTVSGQQPIVYTYDTADRVTGMTQGSLTASFAYDSVGRVDTVTVPGGFVQEATYSPAGSLTAIDYSHPSTPGWSQQLTYGYDARGLVVDTAGGTPGWVHAHRPYDLPPAVSGAAYDRSRLVSWQGGPTLGYDDDGNLVSEGARSYQWNARGELVSVTGGGGPDAGFGYDATGRRRSRTVGSTTMRFLHAGADVAQEQDASGTPTADLLVGEIDQYLARVDASGVQGFVTDGFSSVVGTTSGSNQLSSVGSFEPFGQVSVSGSGGNERWFTGREDDGTGLYFFRARYYQPEWGRFISEDPAGLAGGPNPYLYLAGNPLGGTDPHGQIGPGAICAIGAITNVAIDYILEEKMTWRKVVRSAVTGCVFDIALAGASKVHKVVTRADDVYRVVSKAGSRTDDIAKTAGKRTRSGAPKVTPGATCSFSADTHVLMANGERRAMKDVQVGDEVVATDPETGETSSRTVTDTMVMLHDGDLLDVTIEGDGGAGIVYTTDEHRFWSITDNAWVPAIELDEGDQLRQADGTTATVTDVDERDGRQDMWDLTVAVDHAFYVATGGDADDPSALVHNQGKWCSPSEWANSKWREIRNKYRDDPNFPSGQHDAGLRAAIREARELIRTGELLPEAVEELERIIDYGERAARGIGHR